MKKESAKSEMFRIEREERGAKGEMRGAKDGGRREKCEGRGAKDERQGANCGLRKEAGKPKSLGSE